MLPHKLFLFVKAIHVAFVIFWMAGILYLPRLFVYHTKAVKGGEAESMLEKMELRLIKFIMRPARIIVLITGVLLFCHHGGFKGPIWLHVKLILALSLYAFDGFLVRCHKNFLHKKNRYPEIFYRVINEFPSFVILGIAFLIFMKIIKY